MNKLFQTATPVHDEKQSDLSRRADHMREGAIMLGMTVFSQLLAFSALYMLPVAATSAWWGALLLIVPALLLWGFGMLAARGMPQNAFERAPYRVIAGVLAVLFLSDMAVDLLAMIELTCAFILPGTPRFWLAMIAAIAVGVGTPYKAPDAASRTARFLRWFFIGSFVFCAATVMPQGETGYLFPWAGYGVRHTLRCAALGGGGCWTAAVLPLLSHAEPRQAARQARTWLPQLVAVFMIALLLLCCAYVLPATSLGERWGFVLRLQMLMNISQHPGLVADADYRAAAVPGGLCGLGQLPVRVRQARGKAARAAAALCAFVRAAGAHRRGHRREGADGRPAAALSHRRAAGGDDIDL